MNIIGVDYGKNKIGLAIGQSVTGTASPLKTVKNNSSMYAELNRIVNEWQPKCFVIGEPKLADDTLHPLEKEIQSFINELNLSYNLRIYREDEALTSFEASKYRKNAKDRNTDAYASAIILESWLRNNINILKGD